MRVKFELSGPGQVWIDNAQLHDLLFPIKFYERSEPEKLELVKLISAADSALENGRYSDCVALLEGYWPRYLNAYTPAVAPTIATQPAITDPAAPTTQAEPAAETPSVGSRWFDLPSLWKR
jgi:hypothetical protein